MRAQQSRSVSSRALELREPAMVRITRNAAAAVPAAAKAVDAPCADERVRARAYELYMRRKDCGSAGDAETDWLTAERELNGFSGG